MSWCPFAVDLGFGQFHATHSSFGVALLGLRQMGAEGRREGQASRGCASVFIVCQHYFGIEQKIRELAIQHFLHPRRHSCFEALVPRIGRTAGCSEV